MLNLKKKAKWNVNERLKENTLATVNCLHQAELTSGDGSRSAA